MAHPANQDAAPEKAREDDGGGLNHPTPASEASRGNEQPETAGFGEVEHMSRTVPGSGGTIEVIEDSGIAAGEEIVDGEMEALHDRSS